MTIISSFLPRAPLICTPLHSFSIPYALLSLPQQPDEEAPLSATHVKFIASSQKELVLPLKIARQLSNDAESENSSCTLTISADILDELGGSTQCIHGCHFISLDESHYALERMVVMVPPLDDTAQTSTTTTTTTAVTPQIDPFKILRNQWVRSNQTVVEMGNGDFEDVHIVDMIPRTMGFVNEHTEMIFMENDSLLGTVDESGTSSADKSSLSIASPQNLSLFEDDCFPAHILGLLDVGIPLNLLHSSDVHNLLFISVETARALDLPHNTWIYLSPQSGDTIENQEHSQFTREVCVFVSERFHQLPFKHFICTRELAHNLIHNLPSSFSEDTLTFVWERMSESEYSVVGFATQCTLSLIQSPNQFTEHGHKCSQYSFDQYFSSSRGRFLREGDIISIRHLQNTALYPDEDMDDRAYFDPLRANYSYYLVAHLIQGNYVRSDATRLSIQGEVAMKLPPSHPPRCSTFSQSKLHGTNDQFDLIPYTRHKALYHIFRLCAQRQGSMMQEFQPSILLTGAKGTGKRLLVHRLCERFGFHLVEINLFEFLTDTEAETIENVEQIHKMAKTCSPCVLYIRNFDALARENNNEFASQKSARKRQVDAFHNMIFSLNEDSTLSVLWVCSTRKPDQISKDFRRLFNQKVNCDQILDADRINVLKRTFIESGCPLSLDINLSQLVSGLLAGYQVYDLHLFVQRCIQSLYERQQHLHHGSPVLFMRHLRDVASGIQSQENKKNKQQITIPKVSWDDIGGLEKAKKQILDTIQLPLQKPHLFSSGMKKRSGIILFGPPGCGKTLLAKAVATECKLNFLSVKGPELISMYIGESERNIRELFSKAHQQQPCVIFFDELDALAPNRGKSGDAGGLMDRIVSQLLSELDREPGEDSTVFVMGATNRVDLVDNSLLRSGRFDVAVEIGICEGDDRLKVLTALTRKFELAPDVDLEEIVQQCPVTMSGADYYALCSDAMLNCILRKCHHGDSPDSGIIVEKEDFLHALRGVNPSLSTEQISSYRRENR